MFRISSSMAGKAMEQSISVPLISDLGEIKPIEQGKLASVTQKQLEMANKVVNTKPWVNLFDRNKMALKGMDLQFVPPMFKDGVKML